MQYIYGLYIISSADGLLYDALFGECAAHNASENTRIQLASSFASMSHIAKQLSPIRDCTGITSLEADSYTVQVRPPAHVSALVNDERRPGNDISAAYINSRCPET
jgi:hypothetical protein